MKLLIADYVVEVRAEMFNTKNIYEEYLCDDTKTDIDATFTDAEWEIEKENMGIHVRPKIAADFCNLRNLAEKLPHNGALVFHAACFDVDGTGVAFAAHSGTGKTTHMSLWQKLLGERMTIVNGDKPIIRFFDGEKFPFAYGTPWNGKEGLGCNMKTPFKHICFIERSETNFVEKVEKSEVINRIFKQVYMPKDPIAVMKTMELVDRMLSTCNLWIIHCNMEDDAALVSYNAIFGNEK